MSHVDTYLEPRPNKHFYGFGLCLASIVLDRYILHATLVFMPLTVKNLPIHSFLCRCLVVRQWAVLAVNIVGALFLQGIVPADEAICLLFTVM